jgi:hypothetical protein
VRQTEVEAIGIGEAGDGPRLISRRHHRAVTDLTVEVVAPALHRSSAEADAGERVARANFG